MKKIINIKRQAIRFLCGILALCLCAGFLVSCTEFGFEDPQTESDTTTTTAAETETTAVTEPLNGEMKLVFGNQANVRLVYQTTLGSNVIEAMEALRSGIEKQSGVRVPSSSDLAENAGITPKTEEYKIIIGIIENEVVQAAMNALPSNSYSITVSENRIIVVASNPFLYPIAAQELIAGLSVANGTVTLSKTFEKKGENLPVVSLTSEYTIVYANGDETAQSQANVLKYSLSSSAGITVSVSADTKSASGKEILIGKTNRALSSKDQSYYLNAYTCCDEKGNLAIMGNLEAGVSEVIKLIENYGGKGNVDIPHVLLGICTPKGYGNAPEYKGSGTVKLIENFEKFKSYYIQAWGAKEKDYNDYAKKLVDAGFTRYDSNRTHDSLFSTYTDGYNIVNISYLEYATPVAVNGAKAGDTVTYVNIAVESTDSSALPPVEDHGEVITTPQLTMLNSEPAFLVRMKDGRFIFIDGGNDSAFDRVHADLFYEQLVEQNVRAGKPVVAAWIITHPHADHVAGMMRTIQKYSGKFEVERILCNFQSEYTIRKELGGTMETEGPYNYKWQNNLYNEIVSIYPKIQLITVHAGQKFEFTGLTIEVLWTPENLCQPFNVGNDASVLYNLKGDEGSFLVTGDAQPINCKLTNAIWGEDAAADLLNFAHHGYRGGDVDFYATVNAKYGIWTNCWEVVQENSSMHNNPSYNGVDPKADTKIFIPTNAEPVFIFYPGMPESALAPYIRNKQLLS